jgi:hypothetical protein
MAATECPHEKIYVKTFESGRVIWICRLCQKSAGEVDSGDPNRVFDPEEYFRILESFNNKARDRARSHRSA